MSIRYGDGVKDSTGNYFTTTNPELILATSSDFEKEVLKGYKATYWSDLLPKAGELGPIPWGAAWSIAVPQDSVLSTFWTTEQDISKKYIPQAILGKPADFDKTYDTLVSELNTMCAPYMAAETALVKDRLTLWGSLK
jgi:putative aldouronate transport system substrate-binding protein